MVRFQCVDLWCEEMRENIVEVKKFFSEHCQSASPKLCQVHKNIIKTYTFSKCWDNQIDLTLHKEDTAIKRNIFYT